MWSKGYVQGLATESSQGVGKGPHGAGVLS